MTYKRTLQFYIYETRAAVIINNGFIFHNTDLLRFRWSRPDRVEDSGPGECRLDRRPRLQVQGVT